MKIAEQPSARRRPWSLSARLTAWYAGSAFFLIAGATGFLYWVLSNNLDREDAELVAQKISWIQRRLRERPNDLSGLVRDVESGGGQQYGRIYVRILDANGALQIETPGIPRNLTGAFRSPDIADAPLPREVRTSTGQTFLLASARLDTAGSEIGILHLALDRTYEEALLETYRRNLWAILAFGLALSALAGYVIARRGLQPVHDIANAAGRIRATTLHERLSDSHFPAELAELANTFNQMLDRLEGSFRRLGQFSADIAHELRTPVNNMRGEVEVALSRSRSSKELRDVLGSCLEECGRLTGLVDNLLFLARAEHPETQLVREDMDVGQELTVVGAFYEAAAAEAGVSLVCKVPGPVVAPVDRTLFQRAVANVIANALAHTPAGGAITLHASADGGCACVEVEDTGAGIPAAHLPHVFDRFYRVDASRGNAGGRVGLGLAIVKGIVQLHGGTVSIRSAEGRGTSIAMTFPGK